MKVGPEPSPRILRTAALLLVAALYLFTAMVAGVGTGIVPGACAEMGSELVAGSCCSAQTAQPVQVPAEDPVGQDGPVEHQHCGKCPCHAFVVLPVVTRSVTMNVLLPQVIQRTEDDHLADGPVHAIDQPPKLST